MHLPVRHVDHPNPDSAKE